MKINGFADAVKNKPNQTQPVVSLSNLPVVSLSNLPVVSLPALSKPVPSAVEGVEGVEVSNLFQYKKSGFKSKLLIFDHFLPWLSTPKGVFSHLTRCPKLRSIKLLLRGKGLGH